MTVSTPACMALLGTKSKHVPGGPHGLQLIPGGRYGYARLINCLPPIASQHPSAYELIGSVHIACTTHEQLFIRRTNTLHIKHINFNTSPRGKTLEGLGHKMQTKVLFYLHACHKRNSWVALLSQNATKQRSLIDRRGATNERQMYRTSHFQARIHQSALSFCA